MKTNKPNWGSPQLDETCYWMDLDDTARAILLGRMIDSKRCHEESKFTINYDSKEGDFTFSYTLKGKHSF
jgi:hypothetical protein